MFQLVHDYSMGRGGRVKEADGRVSRWIVVEHYTRNGTVLICLTYGTGKYNLIYMPNRLT